MAVTGTGDRTGASAITNAPPGDYTLTCDDNVFGYAPPASETLTRIPGGTIAFTPLFTLELGPNEIGIILPGDVPLVMVRIPADSFQMVSPDAERSRANDEGPVHTVNIAYDFYMGTDEHEFGRRPLCLRRPPITRQVRIPTTLHGGFPFFKKIAFQHGLRGWTRIPARVK